MQSVSVTAEAEASIQTALCDGVRKYFDKYSNDGHINHSELESLIRDLTKDEKGGDRVGDKGGGKGLDVATVLACVDEDGSGTVEFAEFLKWWREFGLRQAFAKVYLAHNPATFHQSLSHFIPRIHIFSLIAMAVARWKLPS
jgi:hypothetical protein